MKGARYQLFDELPKPIEDALRASIERFGVLVAVTTDQHGNLLDGHHRVRIAKELGRPYAVNEVKVAGEDEAREVARTLNADRRQLTEEQRREVVAMLAAETVAVGRQEVARHSPNAIAAVVGTSLDTVQRDIVELTDTGKLVRPEKTLGQDGKVRPTKRDRASSTTNGNAARKPYRLALPTAFDRAARDLVKAVERVDRLTLDDRFAYNAEQVARMIRHDLLRALELLSQAVERVPDLKRESTE